MGRGVMIPAGILALIVIVVIAAVALGRARFERRISGEVEDLLARNKGIRPDVLTEADLAGLPDPVQHWLRCSQVVGKVRPIRAAA